MKSLSSRERQAWALLLPLLIIIAGVTGYPLFNTFRLSFTDASLTGRRVTEHWVGFENFAYVFADPDFGAAFRRTPRASGAGLTANRQALDRAQ